MTNATKYKFKRQWNPKYKGEPTKNESGVSVTQPSMTLTVKELMERHTRGLETDQIHRDEIYLEDGEEVPRIDDLTDIVYMKEEIEEKRQELEKQINDEKREAKERREAKKRNNNTREEYKSHEDDTPQESQTTEK